MNKNTIRKAEEALDKFPELRGAISVEIADSLITFHIPIGISTDIIKKYNVQWTSYPVEDPEFGIYPIEDIVEINIKLYEDEDTTICAKSLSDLTTDKDILNGIDETNRVNELEL